MFLHLSVSHSVQGGGVLYVAGETATVVDGTHATGMHYYFLLCFFFNHRYS